MSSELSLDTILNAINAVKAEVAVLASSLRSAERRIERLEQVTHTPPVSPLEGAPAFFQQSSEQAISHATTEHEIYSDPAHPTRSCARELPCDIQHHLQPVNDGIAALTEHLLRIESSIAGSSSNHSCTSCKTSKNAPERPVTPKQQCTAPSKSSKLLDSLGKARKVSNVSTGTSPPVFGQPSTPSHRIQSLDIAGSPFGNYVDERSPFSQLARQSTSQPGALYSKPLLPSGFQGLTGSPQKAFGTPPSAFRANKLPSFSTTAS